MVLMRAKEQVPSTAAPADNDTFEEIGGQFDGANDCKEHAPSTAAPAAVARPREAPSNTTSSEGQDVEHQPGPAAAVPSFRWQIAAGKF